MGKQPDVGLTLAVPALGVKKQEHGEASYATS